MKKVVTKQQSETIKKVLRYIRKYWFYLGCSIVLAGIIVGLTLYLADRDRTGSGLYCGKRSGGFCRDPCDLKENGDYHCTHGNRAVDHECLQQ